MAQSGKARSKKVTAADGRAAKHNWQPRGIGLALACAALVLGATPALSARLVTHPKYAHPKFAHADLAHAKKPVAAKPIAVMAPDAPPAAPFPENDIAKPELTAGDVSAKIGLGDASAVVPANGSQFVTVTLTFTGTTPAGAKAAKRQATVLAEADSGQIGSIAGGGTRTAAIAGGMQAVVVPAASGPTALNVELVVKSGAKGPDGKLRSRLRLTLVDQTGARDQTTLSWPLTDCAGDYKTELTKLIEARRGQMGQAVEAASAIDAGLPAAWLFPPAKPSRTAAACVSHGAGRAKTCGATPVSLVTSAGAEAGGDDKAGDTRIFTLASAILAQKGALPQFQHRTQPLRQASATLLNSLRLYMEQPVHPALCSGVDDMVAYYQSRTSLVKFTIEDYRHALEAAKSSAIKHAEALAVSPVATAAKFDAEPLLNTIAATILPPADAAVVAADAGIWPKLRELKTALGSPAANDLAAPRRAQAEAALGMIEATQYLGAAVAKYDRLDESVYGTLTAIADAHKRTCVCGP